MRSARAARKKSEDVVNIIIMKRANNDSRRRKVPIAEGFSGFLSIARNKSADKKREDRVIRTLRTVSFYTRYLSYEYLMRAHVCMLLLLFLFSH